MLSKAVEMGVFFHRASVLGNMEGLLKLRVRFFCQEKLYWGIQETHKRRFWKQATLSTGALLWNLEGVPNTGDC